MLRRTSAILILFSFMMWGTSAFPDTSVNISFFYDELAPYGEWISTPQYGWVWAPDNMAVGWRPYTNGHWVYSDFGWTWVSDLDWGWAAFHYGRWYFDDVYGWVWVPGTVWGPAWVAWRHGGGYVGWAPLPPGVAWNVDMGLSWGSLNFDVDLGWHDWTFCQDRWLVDRNLRKHFMGPEHNLSLIRQTRNITDYAFMNKRIVNRGLAVAQVEQLTRHKVQHYTIQDLPGTAKGHIGRIEGNNLRLFRPAMSMAQTDRTPPPPAAGRTFDYQARQQKLQAYHQKQSKELKRTQEENLKKVELGPSREEMRRRQQQDQANLRDHQQREMAVLQNRVQRAQERAQPPRGQKPRQGGKRH
jgi:hypothetical protein